MRVAKKEKKMEVDNTCAVAGMRGGGGSLLAVYFDELEVCTSALPPIGASE